MSYNTISTFIFVKQASSTILLSTNENNSVYKSDTIWYTTKFIENYNFPAILNPYSQSWTHLQYSVI